MTFPFARLAIATSAIIASTAGLTGAAPTDMRPLKDAFAPYFMVGGALNDRHVSGEDERGAKLARTHFNTITPENVLKWQMVHPEPGKYAFEAPDRFVAFGEKHQMFIVGHTLIWHNQTPSWVFEDEQGEPLTRDALLERMRDHIHTVVGRYRGRIHGWDVVNEALNEDGSLRESPYLRIIGEDYIAQAFRFAHEADPQAQLYYNDYGIENEAKWRGAVRIVQRLQEQGVPIHGVGIQNHVTLDWPTDEQLTRSIQAFAALGVKVMITELDVDPLPRAFQEPTAEVTLRAEARADMNPYVNGLPDAVQQQMAARYAQLFRVYLKNSDALERVTFWGVDDGSSWLNNWPIRGRTNYPLLWDREGRAKPAFNAVLKTVPPR